MKKRQKARFLSPRSSKITVTKEKERRKRKSEEKESRRREKAMVALLVFIIATLDKGPFGDNVIKNPARYIQLFRYFEKGCRKKCARDNPERKYGIWSVPDNCSCRTYFCCLPLALENTFPWPFVPILSNFFEERRSQNHSQCLLGLSGALLPTIFLKIAVYIIFC